MNAGGEGSGGGRRRHKCRTAKLTGRRAGRGRNRQQAAGRRGAGVFFNPGSPAVPEAGRSGTEIQAFKKLEDIIKKLRSINERILQVKQAKINLDQ